MGYRWECGWPGEVFEGRGAVGEEGSKVGVVGEMLRGMGGLGLVGVGFGW